MVLIANRYILPAALKYQTAVAQSVAAVKAAGGERRAAEEAARRARRSLIDELKGKADALAHKLEHGGAARRSTRSTSATASCPRWRQHPRRRATPSSCSSRTAIGRCRRTGRCCSSSRAQGSTAQAHGAGLTGWHSRPERCNLLRPFCLFGTSTIALRTSFRTSNSALRIPVYSPPVWTGGS